MDHVPLEDADERLKKPFRDYVKQKGWGKGFTDWSLLIANANQLHFVVTHPEAHLRNLETVFLSLSITLQVYMTYSSLDCQINRRLNVVHISFSNFSCMFLNSKKFSILNSNCSNLLGMRNLQEQVKKAFCYQKLF